MRPLVFTWPYWVPFWIVYVWAFAPEFGIIRRAVPKTGGEQSKDSGSMAVIMMGSWVANMLAFPLAFYRPLRVPAQANLAAFIIGTLVLVSGSLLRRHCFRVLGEYFTGNVQARTDQPVIDRGAYRFVRHPSYTGGILMFTGTGIALGSWLSTAILLVISVAAYSYRIVVEERALLSTIGEPYARYAKRTKRLVPFIV
jgi:protein-S-isoprenylcysteine O-methyltransferase Ste14